MEWGFFMTTSNQNQIGQWSITAKYATCLFMRAFVFLLGFYCLSCVLSISSYAQNYTYDSVGRLIGVTYDDGSSITYTFDAAGNRLSFAVQKSDIDGDGLPDDFEQAIIDSNPSDDIETIDDVLPENDFDGDGYSNLRELFSMSNAIDKFNIPGCTADSSNGGVVDGTDISNMAEAYKIENCTNNGTCHCDFNNDGGIDDIDLLFLSEDFGRADCF